MAPAEFPVRTLLVTGPCLRHLALLLPVSSSTKEVLFGWILLFVVVAVPKEQILVRLGVPRLLFMIQAAGTEVFLL